jgi:mRNA-degrading endonuclease RelE of RelBE toxin-antitoxin system
MPRGAAGSWSIEFTRSAFKEYMRLDSAMRERIAESLEWLSEHPRSAVLDIKKLHTPVPVYRLRVGDHRVVYELKYDRLLILVGACEASRSHVA